MGCAGSKPHLPSLSTNPNHLNSPQKGFILFNAKTIEYLSANEPDIKTKLIQRCETKLIKTATISSSKSLLSNAKRTLLPHSNSNNNNNNSLNEESSSNATACANNNNSKKSNLSLTSNENKYKEFAIHSAVDYVLKYAINDFDIENFKSSNHLSMKQIRKDIMKKYSSTRSSSKLNTSISNTVNLNNSVVNANNSSNTLNPNATMTLKCQDSAFYKLALHTAIDEFGSFIQENFININEFEPEKQQKSSEKSLGENQEDNKSEAASSINDQEALDRQKAMELARQNFYMGKKSMVCVNKAGAYVVKEIKDEPCDTSVLCSPKKSITLESTLSLPKENLAEEDNKTNTDEKQEAEALEEFLKLKNDMAKLLNETIESIVNYTTKSGIFNDSTSFEFENEDEKSQFIAQLQSAFDQCLLLKDNLDKSNHIIDIFSIINEKDYNLIDEKLIEITMNLDYVNREFRSYLKLLEDSLKHQLTKMNEYVLIKENSTKVLEKNGEIRQLVEDLHRKITKLPKKLFMSKGLPHPFEANHSPSNELVCSQPTSPSYLKTCNPIITIEKPSSPGISTVVEPLKEVVEPKTELHAQPINIKKEIAYSILNLGEVLAKQIDYYSLDAGKDGQPNEELNQLIQMSEQQAAIEKAIYESKMSKSNSSSSTKSVDGNSQKLELNQNNQIVEPKSTTATEKVEEKVVVESESELEVRVEKDTIVMAKDEEIKSNENHNETAESSLSSPSLSNSLSPISNNSGSSSPVNMVPTKQEILIEKPPSVSQSNGRPSDYFEDDLDVLETAKSITRISNNNIKDEEEIANLVNKMNGNSGSVSDEQQIPTTTTASSSSSSDVISTGLIKMDEMNHVNKFIENIIENASQRVNNDNVVMRNNENSNNNSSTKRMSLDEELLYQLEQVDKKVKYMNETCSENEDDESDDDELDDENLDFDESNNSNKINDDDKLFHPRTPAKIKSQVRQARAVDLHEEIKQISNVIHDLVQTINVNRSQTTAQNNNNELNNSNSDNNSEDNSGGSLGDYSTSKLPINNKAKVVKRNGSTSSSGSNIPIRQSKILIKQKAQTCEEEIASVVTQSFTTNNESSINSESFKSAAQNFESFVDLSKHKTPENSNNNNNSRLNKSHSTTSSSSLAKSNKKNNNINVQTPNSAKQFKSKLPVKK